MTWLGSLVASGGQFSDNGCVTCALHSANIRVLAGFRGQFSCTTVMYQDAKFRGISCVPRSVFIYNICLPNIDSTRPVWFSQSNLLHQCPTNLQKTQTFIPLPIACTMPLSDYVFCISLHKDNTHYPLKLVGACRPQTHSRWRSNQKVLKMNVKV